MATACVYVDVDVVKIVEAVVDYDPILDFGFAILD